MSTVYERRVEQEWRLLLSLAETNPEVVKVGSKRITENGVAFRLELRHTNALVSGPNGRSIQPTHEVILQFPRFFPSLPLEASLVRPVFHPNVHPENGFVCLWGRFFPGDTVIEGVGQLQKVITWELLNREADHLMQPDALEWMDDPTRSTSLPLPFRPVRKPEGFALASTYRGTPENRRRRLS